MTIISRHTRDAQCRIGLDLIVALILGKLRLLLVVLISVFSSNMAFAVPMTTSEVLLYQTENPHVSQTLNVGFAARAPPITVSNVAVTGGDTVMQSGAFALHGQETVAALFGFDADHIATNSVRNGLPDTPSQIRHIFGDRAGHLPDTPANRQLLLDTSNNSASNLGSNRFGNQVHASTRPDGSQVWVETRNGVIQNGGVNNPPRTWTDGEGLR